MVLTSKYIDDDNHVKYAPITTPNAVRWPDGSNLNDKLGSISYNDLEDKPAIPDAQIQSDWNQSDNTQKDFIKNKPTIPTVPTNVSAFTNDAGYLTQHQDITGKEDTANKKTTITGNELSTTYYPSTKAVADYVSGIVGEINTILDNINGEVI